MKKIVFLKGWQNLVISKVEIEKFRAFRNVIINLAPKITAIAGKNGTLKTTLLGIIGQPFSLKKHSIMNSARTLDGYNFKSQFKEKFKLSKEKDIVGEHKWKLYINTNIYDKDDGIFEVKSILRDKKTGDIRFWNAKSRSSGAGYIKCPVLYLSLKRVSPIGEEKKMLALDTALDSDEKGLLINWYNDILTNLYSQENYNIKDIKSLNKYSVSVNTDDIDPITISAGQDNIGKILLAILSFRKLQKNYQNDYKGGVLLIDEIESTLHSSALKRLIRILVKSSDDYKIQILLTTHSEEVVIKELLSEQYNRDNKVLYLQKVFFLLSDLEFQHLCRHWVLWHLTI
jgi:AAA15 family ATPase/GTPase